VTPVYQHELPNVLGKSIKGVLVEYGPGGYSPGHTHSKSAFIYATGGGDPHSGQRRTSDDRLGALFNYHGHQEFDLGGMLVHAPRSPANALIQSASHP
jgi:hypothetical protein